MTEFRNRLLAFVIASLIWSAVAAIIILGISGLIHFTFWKPYIDFPWADLRLSIALGVVGGVMFACSDDAR